MKLPNGYGSVYRLSGKRRNPFAVRITVRRELDLKTNKPKQIYKYLGYYKTRQAAMIALAEYNKNPYDLNAKKITFADIFEKWSIEKHESGYSGSGTRGYNAAFKLSHSLHDMKFIEIRKPHMQAVIDGNVDKSYSSKAMLKTLYGQLYKFALENDIMDKNYASFVTVPKTDPKSARVPFSSEEIQRLWDSLEDIDHAEIALIMIYTGLRPGELILVENDNINLNERYLTAGIKTAAGKDRIIPINRKIHPLIEKQMDDKNKYLFVSKKGDNIAYPTFRQYRWAPLMKTLGMDHKAHDARHTFASLMDSAGANQVSIKKIMGHVSQDLTERVYTHKNIDELLKAIDLI